MLELAQNHAELLPARGDSQRQKNDLKSERATRESARSGPSIVLNRTQKRTVVGIGGHRSLHTQPNSLSDEEFQLGRIDDSRGTISLV